MPRPRVRSRRLQAPTVLLGTASVLTATVLSACGGVSAGGDDDAGGEVSSITTMGFGLGDEIATARVDAYTEKSGVDVEVNEGGFDEQQFLSAVASGSPPDTVRMDRNTLGTYASRGALMPLDECIDTAGVDMEAFRAPRGRAGHPRREGVGAAGVLLGPRRDRRRLLAAVRGTVRGRGRNR